MQAGHDPVKKRGATIGILRSPATSVMLTSMLSSLRFESDGEPITADATAGLRGNRVTGGELVPCPCLSGTWKAGWSAVVA